MKWLVVLIAIAIVVSLLSAVWHLVKGGNDSKKMLHALTWRVSLSLLLFVFLLVGFWLGWFVPHQANF